VPGLSLHRRRGEGTKAEALGLPEAGVVHDRIRDKRRHLPAKGFSRPTLVQGLPASIEPASPSPSGGDQVGCPASFKQAFRADQKLRA
jgi:hypothetical protein